MASDTPDPTPHDALQQAVNQKIGLYDRQIITETELNNGVFCLFVDALCDYPDDTARVAATFELLSDSIWSHFEYLLRHLPCEGGNWNWPPGGAWANPGGVVAWQTPVPEVQNAIATLRQCAADYWEARGRIRNVAPGGPAELNFPKPTKENLRNSLVLWMKGILPPEDILGTVLDYFDEVEVVQDFSACDECDRQRVRGLMESYRPSGIPWNFPGPSDPEHQRQRERKYVMLLRLLGLKPSPEWSASHRTEPWMGSERMPEL